MADILIIIACGIVAGFFNVAAAGGSLLTLPMLIFLGLPSVVANGTNRVALLIQNIVSVSAYAKQQVISWRYALQLGVAATIGAVIGAYIAVEVSDLFFNRLLAIMMVLAMVLIVGVPVKDRQAIAYEDIRNKTWGMFIFFLLGIYGGVLHAGIGFLMVLIMVRMNGLSILMSNSIKVTVALIYTIPVLLIFIYKGAVDWEKALFLSIGNAIGAWLGATFSIKSGELWLKRILIIALLIMAIALWMKQS